MYHGTWGMFVIYYLYQKDLSGGCLFFCLFFVFSFYTIFFIL